MLGILGIVLSCGCQLLGLAAAIPAIVLGSRVKALDAQRPVPSAGSARAGVVLGWVGVGLAVVATIGSVALGRVDVTP